VRPINVSTEVFAEIWKRHKAGDRGEDDILRRLLSLTPRTDGVEYVQTSPTPQVSEGYVDDRFGIQLPEGFEIFRIYKGREFRACATHGRWLLLNDNQTYPSLNKLSWAVVQGNENTWHNWKYKDLNGRENFIHALRDQTRIAVRA
jgi:hypothetical protein